MPMRSKIRCLKFGCPLLVSPDIKYCDEHQQHAQQIKRKRYEDKRNDEVWQLYQTPRWKNFRSWLLARNPICQLIVDGQQCTKIANTVHHLKAVRKYPDLLLVASNCVCLCPGHHDHRPGEDENDERKFAPTREDVWGTS